MDTIRLDASKILTIGATLLCLGGVASYTRTQPNLKPIALNIALIAGSIAATNHLASKWHETIANEQLETISGRLKEKIEGLTKDNSGIKNQFSQQSKTLDEVRAQVQEQDKQLDVKTAALTLLQQKVYQIQEDFKRKTEELDAKLQQDDTRFSEAIATFKDKLLEDLSNRIYEDYNRLHDSVTSKLRNATPKLESHLQNFQEHLGDRYQGHCEKLNSLRDSSNDDFIASAITTYSDIVSQIASLKVRFRNLLNIEERTSLEDAYTTLGDIAKTHTPKEKAQSLLREFNNHANQNLENLTGKINEHANSIDEMREQVGDLLNQLDQEYLKIAQLNQEIAKLKEPIIWKIAPNQATRTGNTIIVWCKDKGIHLDRSHYTGDKYEADLYFFTDRLNAAQTVDIKALNEEGENLAQLTHCLEPIKFTWDYESRLVIAHIVMLRREKTAKTSKDFLQSPDKLIQFVRDSYHVGLWGSTGQGKTVAISNIIGGMVNDLGGRPTIRTTIPKIDEDTRKLFPAVNWLGVPNSIFGLLESALEIQYRIHKNEQAYLNDEPFPEFEPILFFIDEINLVFTRWKKVSEGDLEDVLGRFEMTLSGERLEYFRQYMRSELENYKTEFAKRLLLFTWQTGRSLKVKSLIAGQNLQPGSFGFMKNDLNNCSYLALGKSAKGCIPYKVSDYEIDKIQTQYDLIQKELESNPELKFTGLYCPSVGNSYFGILPLPNYYKWDKNLLASTNKAQLNSSYQELEAETYTEQELDVFGQNWTDSSEKLDGMSKNVQKVKSSESLQEKGFQVFRQLDKVPKRFQKLSYEGLVQLWQSLPKKPNGTTNKVKAYETVFEVTRSEDRKIVSEFIDYLDNQFK